MQIFNILFHKAKGKTQFNDENEWQLGAEFKQTQSEQCYGPNWKQGNNNKNKTYFGIEIGLEMEWKKMSERKLRNGGIVNEHATWMVNWIQDKCRCRHLRAHNTHKIRPIV